MVILKLENIFKDFSGLEVLFGISTRDLRGGAPCDYRPEWCWQIDPFQYHYRIYKPSKGRIFFLDKDITAGRPIRLLEWAFLDLSRSLTSFPE